MRKTKFKATALFTPKKDKDNYSEPNVFNCDSTRTDVLEVYTKDHVVGIKTKIHNGSAVVVLKERNIRTLIAVLHSALPKRGKK